MQISVTNNQYTFILDTELYNSDVLHQCFYWYNRDFEVEITSHDQSSYCVSLISTAETSPDLEILTAKSKEIL